MSKTPLSSAKQPHPLAILVGENIVTMRKLRSLEGLAEMVGVGQQSLSRMEKGR